MNFKHILSILLVAVIATTSQAQFNGTLTFAYADQAEMADGISFSYLIDNGKLMLVSHTELGDLNIVPNLADGHLYSFDDKNPVYFKTPFDLASYSALKGSITATKSNETRQIQGLQAERIDVKLASGSMEVWVATGIGVNMSEYGPVFSGGPEFAAIDLLGMTGFPVLSINKDKLGNIISRNELSSIQKGGVDAAGFKLPEGYEPVKVQ